MSTTGVTGNAPAISFPGIVSGIDYNKIITQLTSLSLAPSVGLNASVATLNNANVELIKINNLLQSVQNSLVGLSNTDIYNAYDATSSNESALTAAGIPGVAAVPGDYTITKVQTATSTSVLGSATAGHSITDVLTSGPYAGTASNNAPLIDSYASVTPSNGTGNLGQITVDGVSLSYNVNTQSLTQILANIQTAVQAGGDAGFTASLVGGTVQFASGDKPISIGSPSDTGNLLDVLKLSNAQLTNTATSGSITGTSNVGGINETEDFTSTNSAGYVTPVTTGFFTLNGTKILVSAGENTSDVIKAINSAGAGVTATYDSTTSQISLTATTTGPQGIVLGAAGDTSNFLTAAGLKTAAGGTTTIGGQSEVDVQTASGGTQKYFSNGNSVTTAIPGITLNLLSNTATPLVVSVSQDTSQLTTAVSTFVSAYNAAVTEINAATAVPVVAPAAPGSGGKSQSLGGGVLFGNTNAQAIVQQLTQITAGFLGSGSTYNSLSTVGLTLTDSFQTLTTSNNQDSLGNSGGTAAPGQNGQLIQSTSLPGTDGTFQPLNAAKFVAAFEANPSAVQSLLNGASGLTNQLGNYLTTVTGAPTLLDSGPVGTIPSISVIQNYENANTDQIQAYQAQIKQITDAANQQASNLRTQFVASESLIAQLQAEQQQLASALGFTVSSSSSGA